MSKYKRLTQQEYETIKDLKDAGKTYNEIMAQTGRNKPTINWVLNGEKPSFQRCKKATTYKTKYNLKELVEVDLSSMPDTVLFEHSKEYIL